VLRSSMRAWTLILSPGEEPLVVVILRASSGLGGGGGLR
jgi:hypothetical protein